MKTLVAFITLVLVSASAQAGTPWSFSLGNGIGFSFGNQGNFQHINNQVYYGGGGYPRHYQQTYQPAPRYYRVQETRYYQPVPYYQPFYHSQVIVQDRCYPNRW